MLSNIFTPPRCLMSARSASGKRSKASATLTLIGFLFLGSASATSVWPGIGAISAACCPARNARTEQVKPSGNRILECSKSMSGAECTNNVGGKADPLSSWIGTRM